MWARALHGPGAATSPNPRHSDSQSQNLCSCLGMTCRVPHISGSPASTGVPSELVRWGGSLLAGRTSRFRDVGSPSAQLIGLIADSSSPIAVHKTHFPASHPPTCRSTSSHKLVPRHSDSRSQNLGSLSAVSGAPCANPRVCTPSCRALRIQRLEGSRPDGRLCILKGAERVW